MAQIVSRRRPTGQSSSGVGSGCAPTGSVASSVMACNWYSTHYGAGSSTVAFEVDGMDGVLADLEHHDIIPESIIDSTATITDPAGNRIKITAQRP